MNEEQKVRITFRKRNLYLLLLAVPILWSLWLSRITGQGFLKSLSVTLSAFLGGVGGMIVWAIIVLGGTWLADRKLRPKWKSWTPWAFRVAAFLFFSVIYAIVTVMFEEYTGISLSV